MGLKDSVGLTVSLSFEINVRLEQLSPERASTSRFHVASTPPSLPVTDEEDDEDAATEGWNHVHNSIPGGAGVTGYPHSCVFHNPIAWDRRSS